MFVLVCNFKCLQLLVSITFEGIDEITSDVVATLLNGTELFVATKTNQRPVQQPARYHRIKTGPLHLINQNLTCDSRMAFMDSKAASKINVKEGDLVKIIHLLRVRSEGNKQQHSPLASAGAKDFEEKKEKVSLIKHVLT
jgi:hypothetical protein